MGAGARSRRRLNPKLPSVTPDARLSCVASFFAFGAGFDAPNPASGGRAGHSGRLEARSRAFGRQTGRLRKARLLFPVADHGTQRPGGITTQPVPVRDDPRYHATIKDRADGQP